MSSKEIETLKQIEFPARFTKWDALTHARNVAREAFKTEPKPVKVTIPYVMETSGEMGEWTFDKFCTLPEGHTLRGLLEEWEEEVSQ